MITRCPNCDIRLAPAISFDQTWLLYLSVCARMNIHPRQLNTKQRHGRIVEKRWIVMWVLRQAGAKLEDIGAVLNRDHSTVMHGLAAVDKRLHSSEADSWQRLIQKASGKEEKVYATKHYPDDRRSRPNPTVPSVNHLPNAQKGTTPSIQNWKRLAL